MRLKNYRTVIIGSFDQQSIEIIRKDRGKIKGVNLELVFSKKFPDLSLGPFNFMMICEKLFKLNKKKVLEISRNCTVVILHHTPKFIKKINHENIIQGYICEKKKIILTQEDSPKIKKEKLINKKPKCCRPR